MFFWREREKIFYRYIFRAWVSFCFFWDCLRKMCGYVPARYSGKQVSSSLYEATFSQYLINLVKLTLDGTMGPKKIYELCNHEFSTYIWNIMCQKCEGSCGLWVLNTCSTWQIRPLFPRSKWNIGEISAFLAFHVTFTILRQSERIEGSDLEWGIS